MPKRVLSLTSIVIIALAALSAIFWWNQSMRPVSSQEKQVEFLIKKGSSAVRIADELHAQGLIKSPLAFKIHVQLFDKQDKIQAGEYNLSPNLSLEQIVEKLIKGPDSVWVTLPEGLRREEIAQKFITSLGLEGAGVHEFYQQFLALTQEKEGYLFPDTYLLPKNTTATKAVALLDATFISKTAAFKEGIAKMTQEDGLGWEEIMILASMVERETKTPEERPVVAGIIIKRLQEDWPLQIDATVQYPSATRRCKGLAQCNWWSAPTKDELAIVSAYNTYLNKGLPPSPISNPGLASIRAVIEYQTSDYWFYLHDSEETIRYAKTYSEHQNNVAKYLRGN